MGFTHQPALFDHFLESNPFPSIAATEHRNRTSDRAPRYIADTAKCRHHSCVEIDQK
jgi:hypothetical protein